MSKYMDITEEQKSKYKERVRKYQNEHRREHREYMRKYRSQDLNPLERRKHSIRTQSRRYLLSKHSRLIGYEIHHCFGYDDPNKFIYIPKTLHKEIHWLLRDKGISANTDHWMAIRELVNSCDQYTYISV